MNKCKICKQELSEEQIAINVAIDYPYNIELKCCENCVDELISFVEILMSATNSTALCEQ